MLFLWLWCYRAYGFCCKCPVKLVSQKTRRLVSRPTYKYMETTTAKENSSTNAKTRQKQYEDLLQVNSSADESAVEEGVEAKHAHVYSWKSFPIINSNKNTSGRLTAIVVASFDVQACVGTIAISVFRRPFFLDVLLLFDRPDNESSLVYELKEICSVIT